MEITTEQRLLKSLLKQENFIQASKVLSPDLFVGHANLIYEALENAHVKFKSDISLPDLRDLVFANNPTLTTANRRAINNILDGIEQENDLTSDVAYELLHIFRKKQISYDIAQLAIASMNNDENNFDEIATLSRAGNDLREEDTYEEVSTDLEEALKAASPENLFKFRMPVLREALSGAGRGNFVIIMARPEIGKSSFAADCAVGYAEQGLKVHYFGNEEPSHKIILNMARAKFHKNDAQLRAFVSGKEFDTDAWKLIQSNLSMFDCVGMSIEELSHHAETERPDVIIADQMDKFKIGGRHGSETERRNALYVNAREIAKRNDLLAIALCQASADAQDHRYIDYSMADMSKTGKAAEADLFIGIGADPGVEETFMRYFTVSKNKIDGTKGCFEAFFRPQENKWEGIE